MSTMASLQDVLIESSLSAFITQQNCVGRRCETELKKKQKKNTSPVDMKGADRTASALLKHVLYNVINSSVAQSLSELAIKCTKKAIMEVEKKKRHDMERKHSFNCVILVHL